jgi:hypothetical protein
MKNNNLFLYLLVCISLIFSQCHTELTPSDATFLISTQQNEISTQASSSCVFKYKLVTPFTQLDNNTQLKAVSDGISMWQKANKRINFLQFSEDARCEMWVKFADPKTFDSSTKTTEGSLFKVPLIGQSFSRKENTKYVIYLSNAYQWTQQSMTKAIAYHTGLMLGMATSKNEQSVMYPFSVGNNVTLDKTDSLDVNRLYPLVCKDADFRFLPITFNLNSNTLLKIRLDKQGTIKIASTGQIRVGLFLGFSTPAGLDKGLFNFPISGYNIVPNFNHAGIIIKKNSDKDWSFCGSYLEFPTDGSEYLELILNINDNDLTDNTGSYQVTISYK